MKASGFSCGLDHDEEHFLHIIPVMARSEYGSGRDQRPCMLFIREGELLLGGFHKGDDFEMIRRHELLSVERAGRLLLTSLKLSYVDGSDARDIFICPFSGSPSLPEIDEQGLGELEELLMQWIPS